MAAPVQAMVVKGIILLSAAVLLHFSPAKWLQFLRDIGAGGYMGRTGNCSNLGYNWRKYLRLRMGTMPVNDSDNRFIREPFTIPGDTTGTTSLDAIIVRVGITPYDYNKRKDTKSILVDGEGKLFVFLPVDNYSLDYAGTTYSAAVNTFGDSTIYSGTETMKSSLRRPKNSLQIWRNLQPGGVWWLRPSMSMDGGRGILRVTRWIKQVPSP